MSSLEFWRLGRWHSSPFSGRSWGKKREREGKEGYFCSVGAHQVFGGQRGGLRVLGGRGTLHQTHLHLQSGLALAAGIAKPRKRGRWLCLLFGFIMHWGCASQPFTPPWLQYPFPGSTMPAPLAPTVFAWDAPTWALVAPPVKERKKSTSAKAGLPVHGQLVLFASTAFLPRAAEQGMDISPLAGHRGAHPGPAGCVRGGKSKDRSKAVCSG